MKLKRKIASLMACSLLVASVPAEAMAYSVPETVRVGLESVCKGASSATIGVSELYVGSMWDGEFEEVPKSVHEAIVGARAKKED